MAASFCSNHPHASLFHCSFSLPSLTPSVLRHSRKCYWLTEPGQWEWAGSQHWLEISSFNWITRKGVWAEWGDSHYHRGTQWEKDRTAISWKYPNSTTSSNQRCRSNPFTMSIEYRAVHTSLRPCIWTTRRVFWPMAAPCRCCHCVFVCSTVLTVLFNKRLKLHLWMRLALFYYFTTSFQLQRIPPAHN